MKRWQKGIVAGVTVIATMIGGKFTPFADQALAEDAYAVHFSNSLEDGVYEGTTLVGEEGESEFPPYEMNVTVTVQDQMIVDLSYSGAEGENLTYAQNAFAAVYPQVSQIQASEVDVDVVSSATESGEGFVKAINNALKKGSFEAPVLKSVEQTAKGMKIKIKSQADAEKYIIFRNGKEIGKTASTTYVDKNAKKNGQRYVYTVAAMKGERVSEKSKALTTYYLDKNRINILINGSAGKMTFTWNVNKKATGYQLQHATKSNFKGAKSRYVKDKNGIIATVSNVRPGTTYYVRVRDYKTVGNKKCFGLWSSGKSIRVYR